MCKKTKILSCSFLNCTFNNNFGRCCHKKIFLNKEGKCALLTIDLDKMREEEERKSELKAYIRRLNKIKNHDLAMEAK